MFKIPMFHSTLEKLITINELLIFILTNTKGIPGQCFDYKLRVKKFKPKVSKRLVKFLNTTCIEYTKYRFDLFSEDKLIPKTKDDFSMLIGVFSVLLYKFRRTLPDSESITVYTDFIISRFRRVVVLIGGTDVAHNYVCGPEKEDWDVLLESLISFQNYVTGNPDEFSIRTMETHNAVKRLRTFIAGLFKNI